MFHDKDCIICYIVSIRVLKINLGIIFNNPPKQVYFIIISKVINIHDAIRFKQIG